MNPLLFSVNNGTFDKIPPEVRRYFTSGNSVTPLFGADCANGPEQDIWVRTRALLQEATSSIQVEMYNIDHPEMVDLLLQERARGVRVQIIVDPPREERDAPRQAAIDRLRQGGVDVVLYPQPSRVLPSNPPAAGFPRQGWPDPSPVENEASPVPSTAPTEPTAAPPDLPAKPADPPGGPHPSDHVKMLLVDGRRVIIGGMNWGSHSPANHDFDVEIEGPAASSLGWLFREDWLRCGGAADALLTYPRPPACGDAYVNLVITADDPHERTLAKTVLRAIRNARRSIHAEMFALTDYRVIDALRDARARGVDVKIILHPLKIGDQRLNERACADLRRAGVEVKWYVCNEATKQKMHAKMGLFDDDQVIIGSANWSTFGFNMNREADVEILSREVNQAFERQFELDWSSRGAEAPTYADNRHDATEGRPPKPRRCRRTARRRPAPADERGPDDNRLAA